MDEKIDGKISKILEDILIYAGAIEKVVSENIKEAGNIIETEVRIKQLQSEKMRRIFELGKDVFETKVIDKSLLEKIEEIDCNIENLKKESQDTKQEKSPD